MQILTKDLYMYANGFPNGTTKGQAAKAQEALNKLKFYANNVQQLFAPYSGRHLFRRGSLTGQYDGYGQMYAIAVFGDILHPDRLGLRIETPGGKRVIDFDFQRYLILGDCSDVNKLLAQLQLHPIESLYATGVGNTRVLLEKEYNMFRTKSGRYMVQQGANKNKVASW